MFRNLIWDVDGTLFDTYPGFACAFQAALADLGKAASQEWITSLARVSMDFCLTSLAERFQLDLQELERKFDQHYQQIGYLEQPAFPGVKELCESICSVGGRNVIVTHRRKVGTAGLLATHHLEKYFSGSITADDGFPRKPAPDAFEAALRDYGLECAETMAVGDRDIDVLAAQSAGIFACLFGPPMDGISADLTISNFTELRAYIFGANC
jgi:HAD superfamily hydrolase (TIGR01549 family)